MGKVLFVISIALSSAILQFIITALFATSFLQGEAVEGIGLLWFFSLPLVIILSIVSLTFYKKYINIKNSKLRALLYVGIILSVTFISPVTYDILSFATN